MGVLVVVMLAGVLWLVLSVGVSTVAVAHIGRSVAVLDRERVVEDCGPHRRASHAMD